MSPKLGYFLVTFLSGCVAGFMVALLGGVIGLSTEHVLGLVGYAGGSIYGARHLSLGRREELK